MICFDNAYNTKTMQEVFHGVVMMITGMLLWPRRDRLVTVQAN